MKIKTNNFQVDVPGGSIFVRRWYSGSTGPAPIILLHDSLGSVELWRDFPEALARITGRDILAYDRLGFGKSTKRSGRPSLNFINEEAEFFFPAIKDSLGINSFILFGHSVGGGMATAIAALNQTECKAVITESAQAFIEPLTISGLNAAKKQFQIPEQFTKLLKWHGQKAEWVLDAWIEVWLSKEFSNWNLDAHLRNVKCPVLAIHGENDEYGSIESPRRIISKVVGPSELGIITQCGHVPHREKKEEVLKLTASFLEKFNNVID